MEKRISIFSCRHVIISKSLPFSDDVVVVPVSLMIVVFEAPRHFIVCRSFSWLFLKVDILSFFHIYMFSYQPTPGIL